MRTARNSFSVSHCSILMVGRSHRLDTPSFVCVPRQSYRVYRPRIPRGQVASLSLPEYRLQSRRSSGTIVGGSRRKGPQSATVDVRAWAKSISWRSVESGTSATTFAIAVSNRAMAAVHHAVSNRREPPGVNALALSGDSFRLK